MAKFVSRGAFERWISSHSSSLAVGIAVRSALRTMPFLVEEIRQKNQVNDGAQRLILSAFRGVSIAMCDANGLLRDLEFKNYAMTARQNTVKEFIPAHKVSSVALSSITACAAAASFSDEASSKNASISAASASNEVLQKLISFEESIDKRPLHYYEIFDRADSHPTVPSQILSFRDLAFIEHLRLWPSAMPFQVAKEMREFVDRLHVLDQGWSVWTRWYDAVLEGRATPGGEELDIYRVTLDSEEDWAKGPAHVNGLIMKKEEEIKGRTGRQEFTNITPDIPAMRPAVIETAIVDCRIVLSDAGLIGDSGQIIEHAAFGQVRDGLSGLLRSCETEYNIDPRFRNFAQAAITEIPHGMPTNEQLFRMGHIARTMQGYAPTVNAEWPALLAAEYHSITLQFDQSLRQFARWREFVSNASPVIFTQENRDTANQSALELADVLSEHTVAAFVDQAIPRLLKLFGQGDWSRIANQVVEEGSDLMAADLLQSISNTLNPIAQIALEYSRAWGQGAKAEALDNAKEDGKKSAKWAKRVILGLLTLTALPTLATMFPAYLSWLPRVIEYLVKLGVG